ncbi:unnamed protein product [Orchesella dallaii]|uniref:Uncharacterized protein n=1 Tax=Orchesella dallaii TaxID=48710 RepID=A0ABP1Q1T1_9HEXA
MLRKRAKNSPSKTSITIQALPTVNQYATDVIAATVFGMNTGTVQNPNATFAKMANRVARFKQMQVVFGLYFPRLSKFLGLEPLDGEALAFFEKLVNEGLQARMSGAAEKRNDFLQMMAEVNKGELKEEVNEEELDNFEKEARIKSEKGKEGMRQYLTEDVINSQSFMFFFAGFRMRLALVECKAAIAHIVHNFRIEPTEKTPIPIKTAKIPFQRVPPQDLELKLIVL